MGYLIALYIKTQIFLENENGATMVEYALMVTFIAVACVAAVAIFGTNLNGLFTTFAGL